MAIQPAAKLTAIPPFPALSDRAAGTYNSKAFAFGAHMGGADGVTPGPFVAEINNLTSNVQTNAQEAANYAIAAAASAAAASTVSAFKGLWTSLSGALAMPATVLHLNAYWMLTRNVSNVAAEVPGMSTAWTPQVLDAIPLAAGTNLNTLIATGKYSVVNPTLGPEGVNETFVVEVIRFNTDAIQILNATTTYKSWRRRISNVTTSPSYSSWRYLSEDAPIASGIASGVIDCANGPYFAVGVASNIVLSLINIPIGAYSFVLEVEHTGGTITLPAGSVWVGGAAPIFSTPRRHLLFFQRSVRGSGGWIVSALPNSAI